MHTKSPNFIMKYKDYQGVTSTEITFGAGKVGRMYVEYENYGKG